MRKLFFTGLVSLLPITMTLIVLFFIINIFTAPFQGTISSFLEYYDLLDSPFLFFTGEQVLFISSKLLALAAVLGTIVLMGFLGGMVLVNTFFTLGSKLVGRIPLINRIYKVSHDAVQTIFSSKGAAFAQVVVVPYPHNDAYCLGFLTKPQTPENHDDKVSVFLPGSPNPTFGFMLTYDFDDLILNDMKVDEALKFIVSCGVITKKL